MLLPIDFLYSCHSSPVRWSWRPHSRRRCCRRLRSLRRVSPPHPLHAMSMPCPVKSKSRHGRRALLPHSSCAAHIGTRSPSTSPQTTTAQEPLSRWRSNSTAPFQGRRINRLSPPASNTAHVAAAELESALQCTMCPAPASGRFLRTPTRELLARAPRPGPPPTAPQGPHMPPARFNPSGHAVCTPVTVLCVFPARPSRTARSALGP